MKKSLAITLALVFVLGIAGTSIAANPFVDVPANHWAYGAVKALAHDGIIDGYSDGTFQGDREMTRYEMAQIVAKAMAREDKANAADKALIEKLQAEFAAELDNLGVRVTNLESKVGNVKLCGDARIRYTNLDKDSHGFQERFRLNLSADINDKTALNARYDVMDSNEFGTTGDKDKNQITVANMTTKGILHNTDLMIGRYDLNLGQTTYLAGTEGMVDGVQATVTNGKASAMLGYASMKNVFASDSVFKHNSTQKGIDNVYYAELGYTFDNNVKIDVNYLKNQDRGSNNKLLDVIGAGVNAQIFSNVRLIGDYWKNRADDINGGDNATGYVAGLTWKGNSPSVPKSFGLTVEYIKMDPNATNDDMTGAMLATVDNVKSWDVQCNYTLAKNITVDAIYQFNMKYANGDDRPSDKYTRLQINYLF